VSEWKVSLEEIKLFPHPNADKLEVARVGTYSLVVQKGLYQDGDVVLFAPKDSLLPDELAEPFRDYLTGAEKNRVKEVRLRGELSQGVVLSLPDYLKPNVPLGEDTSEKLGITEYVRPIPTELQGDVEEIDVPFITYYDVDNYRIFQDDMEPGETVVISEKLHGSQENVIYRDGKVWISSKGLLKRGLAIKESEGNSYWKAFRNSGVQEVLATLSNDTTHHFVGEMIPCQKGYTYGQSEPTLRLFEYRNNTQSLPLPDELEYLSVPILYEGEFSEEKAEELAKGMEQVSGRELHIREGCVVQPVEPRRTSKGTRLILKFINPKYAKKATGEEFN